MKIIFFVILYFHD